MMRPICLLLFFVGFSFGQERGEYNTCYVCGNEKKRVGDIFAVVQIPPGFIDIDVATCGSIEQAALRGFVPGYACFAARMLPGFQRPCQCEEGEQRSHETYLELTMSAAPSPTADSKLLASPTVPPSTTDPTGGPSSSPSSTSPTVPPSSVATTVSPSSTPSMSSSGEPSTPPSSSPTTESPSSPPSLVLSAMPSEEPTERESAPPSSGPSLIPSGNPTIAPSNLASSLPTLEPVETLPPTTIPTLPPSDSASSNPTETLSDFPSPQPTAGPTEESSFSPSSSMSDASPRESPSPTVILNASGQRNDESSPPASSAPGISGQKASPINGFSTTPPRPSDKPTESPTQSISASPTKSEEALSALSTPSSPPQSIPDRVDSLLNLLQSLFDETRNPTTTMSTSRAPVAEPSLQPSSSPTAVTTTTTGRWIPLTTAAPTPVPMASSKPVHHITATFSRVFDHPTSSPELNPTLGELPDYFQITKPATPSPAGFTTSAFWVSTTWQNYVAPTPNPSQSNSDSRVLPEPTELSSAARPGSLSPSIESSESPSLSPSIESSDSPSLSPTFESSDSPSLSPLMESSDSPSGSPSSTQNVEGIEAVTCSEMDYVLYDACESSISDYCKRVRLFCSDPVVQEEEEEEEPACNILGAGVIVSCAENMDRSPLEHLYCVMANGACRLFGYLP